MPEFILVTGSNASGKTSLIETNRTLLQDNKFEIIIPDQILKKAHSLYDGNPIMDLINNAMNEGKNFILETPLQLSEFHKTLGRLLLEGYKTTMYQLFVENSSNSLLRVHDRFEKGGLYISHLEVRENFKANFTNVAKIYTFFDKSHFIDNNDYQCRKLLASFEGNKLIHYQSNHSKYLKELFEFAQQYEKMDRKGWKIINDNADYGNRPNSGSSGLTI